MLSYVPSNDPRIQVEFEIRNTRVLKSDVLTCINAPFRSSTAVAQLSTVRSQMRNLINAVPIEA